VTGSWTPDDAHLALGASGHAVIVTDLDGIVQYWNTAACSLFGWTEAEAIGTRVNDLIDPRGPGQGDEGIRGFAAGARQAAEFHARRKDGSIVPVLVMAGLIADADGEPKGLIGTAIDISDRVEAEAAAASAQARLDVVGAIAGIGTWVWDLTTNEITGDRSLNDMHGSPPDAPWTVDSWFDYIHPDDRDLMIEAASVDFSTTGVMPEVKYRVIRADGTTRVVLGRAEVIEWHEGAPVKLGGVVVDVTDAQRDAQRVLENLEMMSDGYLTLDADWCITYVNHAGEAFLGVTRDALLGQNLWQTFPESVGGIFDINYHAAVATGQPTEFEAYYAPHEAWYEIRAYPNDGALAIYFRNINDRRARVEAQERALTAEREARFATEAASHQLEHAATHDHLTGLANRVALERHLACVLASDEGSLAVLFCDLDRFKNINDGLGHDAGDELLIRIASRLGMGLRDGDLVARIGGDEFVIATRVADRAEGLAIAERLIDIVREPVEVSGRRLVTTMSVGVAFSGEGSTPKTLLRDADAAVYLSKDRGRNQASIFDEALRSAAIARLEVEHDLRVALEADQFVVLYQPSFDLCSGQTTGVEALVRWHHPTRGVVSPADFIPLAEETGLIVPLGRRVVDLVTADARRGVFETVPDDFTIWVNVSGRELAEPHYFDELRRRTATLRLPLGLEVTETVLVEQPGAAPHVLERVAAAGVKIAIDDFGTGYSSFARLADYRMDLVKVDRSFVAQLESTKHRAIVAATIDLAHALGADAIAEAVETESQLRHLRSLGCDQVSGFHLARPVPADQITAAIEQGERAIVALSPNRASGL
jgi:diguanylate cyclase (GGDEF)-like protein/PAS domain S-box-containing protein